MPVKVKFVEYGEQAKVKIVDYGEDLQVIPVEYGEQMRVKIVEYGEDLKVKIVSDSRAQVAGVRSLDLMPAVAWQHRLSLEVRLRSAAACTR